MRGVLLTGCVLLLMGCDEAGGPDAGDPVDAGPVASWDDVYGGVIGVRCAIVGCHVAPMPTGNLDMTTSEVAYGNLVGVTAMGPECDSVGVRVVAGDPADSILFSKVSESTPRCGARMPLGRAPLSATDQETIRSWIAGGAHGP